LEPRVFIHFFLNGLASSSCYFLIASGMSLIFGVLGILNFAQGALFMIGAYLSYQIILWTGNFWLSILIAPLIVAGIGMIIERFLLRHTYRVNVNFQLLLTFGLILVIEDLVRLTWGVNWHTVQEAKALRGVVQIMGGGYPIYNLFYFGVGAVVFASLWFFLNKTKYGKKVIAASSDRELANGLGINVPRLYSVVFGLGSALAGLMGVFHGPFINISLEMGHHYIMNAFAVVVIGGLGNITGAYISALILGQLEAFGILYFPFFERIFMYGLMMVILIWRPRGLFGEKKE
jgi:branched-chain amino acid transport system permease protein